jgi:hypothetical protein
MARYLLKGKKKPDSQNSESGIYCVLFLLRNRKINLGYSKTVKDCPHQL